MLNMEITAYALLTLLQNDEIDSGLLCIVKWLLNQRNNQGGFEGTQDTIVGIEALASFALKIKSTDEKNVKIDIKTSGGENITFNVNENNFLVLQSQKVHTQTHLIFQSKLLWMKLKRLNSFE